MFPEANEAVSSTGSSLGTGGMSTKLTAARLATSAGVTTIITRSSTPSNIFHIVAYCQTLKRESMASTPVMSRNSSYTALASLNHSAGAPDPVAASTALYSATQIPTPPLRSVAGTPTLHPPCPLHTRFVAKPRALRDRYFWILHGLKPHGTLVIDEGAYRALTRTDKAGLLPVGVLDVLGTFAQQECVSVVVGKRTSDSKLGYEAGPEVGRALVNYTSVEIGRIKGQWSSYIHELLGYAGENEYPRRQGWLDGWMANVGQTRSILRTVIIRRSLKGIPTRRLRLRRRLRSRCGKGRGLGNREGGFALLRDDCNKWNCEV